MSAFLYQHILMCLHNTQCILCLVPFQVRASVPFKSFGTIPAVTDAGLKPKAHGSEVGHQYMSIIIYFLLFFVFFSGPAMRGGCSSFCRLMLTCAVAPPTTLNREPWQMQP